MSQKIMVSLCDLTTVMAQPWADAGYLCYCVDTQHPEGETREGNIIKVGSDIMTWEVPEGDIAFVAAFPPCTHLAVSGARWWASKGPKALREAMRLVKRCAKIGHRSDAPWLIENPVGRIPRNWRDADYWFHPNEFGGYKGGEDDDYSKKTGLWVGNGFVMPEKRPIPLNEDINKRDRIHRASPGPERANLRSATPRGFAQAVFEAHHNLLAASADQARDAESHDQGQQDGK